MIKRSIGALALATALMVGTSFPALAATPALGTPTSEAVVQPRINWTGTAKLNTSSYNNIISSNNFFDDSPTVSSDANNPGTVTIRVVNGKGEQVGETKTVSPGTSVSLDNIPAFSGTYTIQGKANVSGTYTFTVD